MTTRCRTRRRSSASHRSPGWAEQHDFVRVEGFADAHTAEPFMNPRKGGQYRVAVARYSDRSGNADGFTRVDVDVQRHVSALQRAARLRAARAGIVQRRRRRGGDAVLPDADAGRRPDAARLPRLPLPRSALAGGAGVSLRDPDRARRRDLLRRRPGGAEARRLRWRDFERDWGSGSASGQRRRLPPPRSRLRRRGAAHFRLRFGHVF